MSQKTFYTNLTSLKLPEIKTISAEIYNKGLIRKEKKNKIRLVDNNSIISHIFVRKERFVRGSSLKLFKARLQHRRDDFYTGNFLLATPKIHFKTAATDLLQKLENLRRRKKEVSVPRPDFYTRRNKILSSLKSSELKVIPKSKRIRIIKIRKDMRKVMKEEKGKKIRSWLISPASKKTLNATKRIRLRKLKKLSPLRLKKKALRGKILPKKKQIISKRNVLTKLKRYSKKFPVMIAGPAVWAGFKVYGCGMKKFLPKSSLLLAGKKILSHIQEKTQLDARNWQRLNRLKSVIPFRVLPAMLGQSLKITPLRFKNTYSQVSMKKSKKTRAIGKSRGKKRTPISIKSVFIHTHKRLIRKKSPKQPWPKKASMPTKLGLPKVVPYIKNENNAKSNKKTDRYFPNKPNTKGPAAFPVRNSDQHQKRQKKQNNNFYQNGQKRPWDREQSEKSTTIQSQQKPRPKK